jgi:hypothetical protein
MGNIITYIHIKKLGRKSENCSIGYNTKKHKKDLHDLIIAYASISNIKLNIITYISYIDNILVLCYLLVMLLIK